jgi:hypothetical protein
VLQPENVSPEPGVAVRVVGVPTLKFALQVPEEQLMPAGLLVTVPVPVTLTDTE